MGSLMRESEKYIFLRFFFLFERKREENFFGEIFQKKTREKSFSEQFFEEMGRKYSGKVQCRIKKYFSGSFSVRKPEMNILWIIFREKTRNKFFNGQFFRRKLEINFFTGHFSRGNKFFVGYFRRRNKEKKFCREIFEGKREIFFAGHFPRKNGEINFSVGHFRRRNENKSFSGRFSKRKLEQDFSRVIFREEVNFLWVILRGETRKKKFC